MLLRGPRWSRPLVGPALLTLLVLLSSACGPSPSSGPAREAAPAAPHTYEPVEGGRLETWSRDLSADERRGGHTIARHVGKSDEELRARLRRERRLAVASTFNDLVTAERVVGEALQDAQGRIERWVARKGRRPNLTLDYRGAQGAVIGRALRRGSRQAEPCVDAVVVLRWDERAGDYYVLTSYPEVRR